LRIKPILFYEESSFSNQAQSYHTLQFVHNQNLTVYGSQKPWTIDSGAYYRIYGNTS